MILSSLKNRLRSRTCVTTFKFQSALDLKNRLRSRTRVATYMFQNAFNLKNRLRSRTRVINSTLNYNTKSSQNGSGVPGPENGSRGTKSITFAKGIFQPFNLQKFLPNPVGEPSVLRIQRPIYI